MVGAAGRVGRAITAACLARGASVSGLARDPAAAGLGLGLGPAEARIIAASVEEEQKWVGELAGCDVLVCALRGMPGAVLPLQLRLLELAEAAG